MQIFQRTDQRFKKIIAWLLIIVLMVPNVAFATDFGHSVKISVALPDGSIAEPSSMTHVTLSVYADNEGEPGALVTSFDVKDQPMWQIDLNNQPALEATKYWLKASAEGENYFLLDSLTIPIDLGTVTGPIDAELRLSSPVLKGTVYMPDGVTPVSDDVNVIISGPGETQISGGVYTFDIWRLGQTVALPFFADVTEDGLSDSDPISLTPSMFVDGIYQHNFVLKEGIDPLTLSYNGYEYFPNVWRSIPLHVQLTNLKATSIDQINVAQYSYDEVANTYTLIRDLSSLKRYADLNYTGSDTYTLYADYVSDDLGLIDNQPVYVGVKDMISNEIIYVKMIPTSLPVIDNVQNIGVVEGDNYDTYYHYVMAYTNSPGVKSVIVRDVLGNQVGTGTLKAFDDYARYVMITEVEKNSIPTKLEIQGMVFKTRFHNDFSKYTNLGAALWKFYTIDGYHHIEVYNNEFSVNPNFIVEITSDTTGKVFDLSMVDKYTRENLLPTNELPGGCISAFLRVKFLVEMTISLDMGVLTLL